MGSVVVVEIVDGRAIDDVLVEGTPAAFDLAVGLRPVGRVVCNM